MATVVRVPVRGEGQEFCVLSEWYVEAGDVVSQGQPLASVETAKAVYDVEAPSGGVVLELSARPGDEMPVHGQLALIGEPGETIAGQESSSRPAGSETHSDEMRAPATDKAPRAAAVTNASRAEAVADSQWARPGRVAASPRARTLAIRENVDLRRVTGTGPGGRVIASDVRDAGAGRSAPTVAVQAAGPGDTPAPEPIADERVHPGAAPEPTAPVVSGATTPTETPGATPLSRVRTVIAKRMTEAAAIPQVTLHRQADAAAVLSLVERMRAQAHRWDLPRITITDCVMLVVSRLLRKAPDINAHLTQDGLVSWDKVHLGLAVDTSYGLMVPTIRDADSRSLRDLSTTSRVLAERARARTLTLDEIGGATFSITSLGALGVREFTPLLNPPQVAILGVGAIAPGVLEIDGSLSLGRTLPLSLTFDHRALDGARAAEFLRDVVDGLGAVDVLLGC
jgi:pyruvate dehydrogenase E2 component (dihydrolipoamide acetyltransferase)